MNTEMLNELKEDLLKRENLLTERLERIQSDKEKKTPLDPDFEEQAIELENNEVVDGLETLEFKELAEVRAALSRIENGTFGVCEVSGNPIDEKRLRAVPFARTCTKHA